MYLLSNESVFSFGSIGQKSKSRIGGCTGLISEMIYFDTVHY